MIDLLPIFALLIFNCLWITGFRIACSYELTIHTHINPAEGMKPIITTTFKSKDIFWWLSYYTQHWPWYIKKPLYDCMACMSSVHGILFLLVFMPFTIETLCLAPIYIGALAGLNQIVANKFDL